MDADAARSAIALIRNRWTPAILAVLSDADGSMRYKDLHTRVNSGVSHQVLSDTMHQLVRDGIIAREYDRTVIPPPPTYRLTDLGRSLLTLLHALETWYHQHRSQVPPHRTL